MTLAFSQIADTTAAITATKLRMTLSGTGDANAQAQLVQTISSPPIGAIFQPRVKCSINVSTGIQIEFSVQCRDAGNAILQSTQDAFVRPAYNYVTGQYDLVLVPEAIAVPASTASIRIECNAYCPTTATAISGTVDWSQLSLRAASVT